MESAGMSETALAQAEAAEWRRKKTPWSSRPYSHAATEFRGVYRLRSGSYGSSIWDPPSRTQVWLGTFVNPEDAARTYAFAKAYGAAAAVKKVPGAGKKKRTRETLRGVQRRSNGRYGASIWDPPSRTQVWLGTFVSVEDAARTYAFARAYGAAAAVKQLPGGGKKRRSRETLRGVQRRGNVRYGASIGERMGRALTSLGTFGTAGRAYDAAAVELHGARAVTNSGPDSVVVPGTGTQRHYISISEWGRVEELLKDTAYSIDERDALIEAAAALHQIAQAGHGDGGRQAEMMSISGARLG